MLSEFEIKRLRYFIKIAKEQGYTQLNKTDVQIFEYLIKELDKQEAWEEAMDTIREQLADEQPK